MTNFKKVAIFNDTSVTDHYGCHLVMHNLISKLQHNCMMPVFFWPVGVDWRQHKSKLNFLCEVDAIIVNGEGSIHHSFSRDRAIYLCELATYVKKEFKKPIYLINATLFNNDPSLYDHIKNFNQIYVRETSSQNELALYNVPSFCAPDLTLAIQNNYKESERKQCLITDSVFLEKSKELRKISIKNGYEYQCMIPKKNIILRLMRKYKKRLFFKRMPLQKKTKAYMPQVFINKLASKEMVITGRFHTVTLSLLTFTPFLTLNSNTPKISALLNDVFRSDKRAIEIQDIKDLSHNQLMDRAQYNSQELRLLKNYRAEAILLIDKMFDSIFHDLD
jgi:polysaccharide pyruvyl transferase WcaK-like protein